METTQAKILSFNGKRKGSQDMPPEIRARIGVYYPKGGKPPSPIVERAIMELIGATFNHLSTSHGVKGFFVEVTDENNPRRP